jgi:hypothetical protein
VWENIYHAILVSGLFVIVVLLVSAANHVERPRKIRWAIPKPKPRDDSGTQFLTEEEKLHIARTGCCPDCETGRLLLGPDGGGQNAKCASVSCGALFVITPVEIMMFGSHRVLR